jgi:XTP/dITP diphosphohydrolase
MTKQNIVFITGNEGKLKEASKILGDQFEVININFDLTEIQTTTVKEVIKEKIKEAKKIGDMPDKMTEIKDKFEEKGIEIKNYNDFTIICEDTGFHINSLNIGAKAETEKQKMFPGALIKFYLQALGPKGIIDANKGSEATISCCIGVIKNGEIVEEPIEGIIDGKVASEFIEGNSFGWDPAFVPNLDPKKYGSKQGLTYAQLGPEIKNEISHRAIAFTKLKDFLLGDVKVGGNKNRNKMKGGGLDFKEKYIKYKNKYTNLKSLLD